MTRLLPIFLAISAFAAAPTNQLVITNTSGSAQTNQPVRFGRPFAEGEIWGHPQPVINGFAATSWQATVKTRHRDGRSSCAVTGATNQYPITVTCANHGYRNGDYVTIAGVLGNTAANGTHRIVRRGRHTFFLQGATGNGAYTSGGEATGPGPGSVRFAVIVVDNDVDLSAGGSVTVTFKDSDNACHLGSKATCEAAALTEAQMLAWDSSGWGAAIAATQGGTYTANARTMIDAGKFEYWVAGPILTEVIVRDHSSTRAFDFGWTCTSSCAGDYSAAAWSTDTINRSLSPVFVLSFFDARPSSVKIEYILENMWYGHLQDQRYSLALTSDSTGSTSEYTKAAFTHYARTRWRKVFWDGAEPGAVNIDHSETYWEYTGAMPVWADDVEPAQADINAQNASGCASAGFDIGDSGCFNKYFPASGDTPAIGVLPQWDSIWAQTFDYGIWSQVWGNGNVSGQIPVHVREASTDTTLYFVDVDGDGSTDNDNDDDEAGNGVFGRIFSTDARPSTGLLSGGTVASLSGSHGWTVDYAHQPAAAFTAYLATGEWYLLEELQFWGAYNSGSHDPEFSNCGRGGSWSLISSCQQTRGQGWAGRNMIHAAWASLDGTGEKEYLSNRVDFNLMANEGRFSKHFHGEHYLPLIGNSDSAPCAGVVGNGAIWTQRNPYCHGYLFWSAGETLAQNPMGVPSGSGNPGCDGLTTATLCDAPWMQDYFVAGFYGRGKDLGFRTDGLLRMVAKWRFQFLHEDHNVYVAFGYRVPIVLNSTGKFPVSPKQHYTDGYTAAGKAKLAWGKYDVYTLANYGYSFTHGALPYMMNGRLGGIGWRYVWDWFTDEANVENTTVRCIDGEIGTGCSTPLVETRWNVGPRFPATKLQYGVPGASAVLLRYTAPSERSCSVDLDDDPGFGSLTVSENDGGGRRDRRRVMGGLSAGQEYFYRIRCLDDLGGQPSLTGSLTTVSAGGATAVEIRPAPPAGQGISAVRVRSGPVADGLSTDSGEIPCPAGCTVSIPATSRVPLFYQLEYLSGASIVSTSQVEAMIP